MPCKNVTKADDSSELSSIEDASDYEEMNVVSRNQDMTVTQTNNNVERGGDSLKSKEKGPILLSIDQFRSHMYNVLRNETDYQWLNYDIVPANENAQNTKLTR